MTQAYWPQLIATDPSPVFHDTDVYVAAYDTPPRGGKMQISDLVTQIMNRMKYDKVFDSHSEVIFIAHSMGGLLTQELLLTYQKEKLAEKVHTIFLYGTPLEGSYLANFAKFFNPDPLVKELQAGDGNIFLPFLDNNWLHSSFTRIERVCAYETLPERGFKVVHRESATSGCDDKIALNSDHHHLVEPADRKADAYTIITNHLDLTPVRPPLAISLAGTPLTPESTPNPPEARPSTLNGQSSNNSLYKKVGRALDDIKSISDQYWRKISDTEELVQQTRGKTSNWSEPISPDLLDFELQSLLDNDGDMHRKYIAWATEFQPIRSEAVSCMGLSLTPNELSQDAAAYRLADEAASVRYSLGQYRKKQIDTNRFRLMSSYVQDVHDKLGNFHCK